jgi:hypothetical protein
MCTAVNPISNWENVGILCALAGGTIVACTVLVLAAKRVGHRIGLLMITVGTLCCIVGVGALGTGGVNNVRDIGVPCAGVGGTIVLCTILVLAVRRGRNRHPPVVNERAEFEPSGALVALGVASLLAIVPNAVLPPLNAFGPPLTTTAYGELAVCFAILGLTVLTREARNTDARNSLRLLGGGLVMAAVGMMAIGVVGQVAAYSRVPDFPWLAATSMLITASGLALAALAVGLLAIRTPRSPADPGDRLWVTWIALGPG